MHLFSNKKLCFSCTHATTQLKYPYVSIKSYRKRIRSSSLFFLVLIPEQALAPAPPPVTSANFLSEVGGVRKTTDHQKCKFFVIYLIRGIR